DEMNNKPGSLELINLNDPFVLYGGVTPIQENSSFTGNAKGIRVNTASRWEWPELGSANFISNSISVDAYAPQVKGGLAIVLSSDLMGGNKYAGNGIAFMYSPKIKVGNTSIEPSIKYGITNRTINWNNISTGDFLDHRTGTLLASSAVIPENATSSNFLVNSFGAGLLINHDVFYAGFSVDNLFSPSYKDELFDQAVSVPLKFTAQLGTDIRKNSKSPWIYSPSVSVRNQGLYNKVWMSNMVRYKKCLVGADFSTSDAMMFSFGYSNSTFRATYSYGLSTVPFNTNTTSDMISSHQLTMRYVIKK
ncbi:MAG: PorP/SprF family type IX secretion system membrane protein, partial [Flavobacteriales bacterium]